ncbi:MAG: colanic acid/amylovoran biosynthesis glycosyltransferase [Verrucomicrobiota bacterium]|jgi:colanic acid/amylovoran biosynthesis glycosyltransferase
MKIAFVVTHFPALSETFVLNQITGLIDRGHDVEIHADRAGDDSKVHPDVHAYGLLAKTRYAARMPGNSLMRLASAARIAARHLVTSPRVVGRALNVFRFGSDASSLKLLHRIVPFLPECPQYDVIHAHFGQEGLRALALRELGVLRGPLLTTFHGSDMSSYLRKHGQHVYDDLFQKGDLFLPISARWQAALVRMGCDAGRIIIHHMGIDVGRFQFRPRRLNAGERPRLLSIARLVEKKGIEFAIRATAKLSHLDFQYDIVGDGPLRRSLEQLIDSLGVAERVRMVGWKEQSEVLKLLDQAHVLIAPSVTGRDGDQEGIPVAMMEAMAMGLPVLSTQHSGIPELVEDGVSGFLVPERDVPALAHRLETLLKYPERWPVMGEAGRRRVEAGFNIGRLNDELVEIFKRGARGALCQGAGIENAQGRALS